MKGKQIQFLKHFVTLRTVFLIQFISIVKLWTHAPSWLQGSALNCDYNSQARVCRIVLILSKLHSPVNNNQNKLLASYTHFLLWREGKWGGNWDSPGVRRFVYTAGQSLHFHNDKPRRCVLALQVTTDHWLNDFYEAWSISSRKQAVEWIAICTLRFSQRRLWEFLFTGL
jgi:hypothetical protein